MYPLSPPDNASAAAHPNRSMGLLISGLTVAAGAFGWSEFAAPMRLAIPTLAVLFLTIALAKPALYAPVTRLWMRLAGILHRIVSPIVMAVLYFGVFTPMGVLMRTFGHDPLGRRSRKYATTAWIARTSTPHCEDDLRNQF